MPWTQPITWTPAQVVAASDLNAQMRDNLLYLLASRPIAAVNRVGAADYTTASGSFVDVDASNLILTLTLNGSRALVVATALIVGTVAGGGCFLDWIVDGTTRAGGSAGLVGTAVPTSGLSIHAATAIGLFTGLAAGAHSFKLQYRGNGTGGATVYNNGLPITLFGLEI